MSMAKTTATAATTPGSEQVIRSEITTLLTCFDRVDIVRVN